MTEQPAAFAGSIPEHNATGPGPHIFRDHALDPAQRAAAEPARIGWQNPVRCGSAVRG